MFSHALRTSLRKLHSRPPPRPQHPFSPSPNFFSSPEAAISWSMPRGRLEDGQVGDAGWQRDPRADGRQWQQHPRRACGTPAPLSSPQYRRANGTAVVGAVAAAHNEVEPFRRTHDHPQGKARPAGTRQWAQPDPTCTPPGPHALPPSPPPSCPPAARPPRIGRGAARRGVTPLRGTEIGASRPPTSLFTASSAWSQLNPTTSTPQLGLPRPAPAWPVQLGWARRARLFFMRGGQSFPVAEERSRRLAPRA
jgi:hypothetical protein